jgi:hypothetical protein
MIQNISLWHTGPEFHNILEDAINNKNIEELNIYAYEEWEIAENWNNYNYYQQLQQFCLHKTLNIYLGCFDSLRWRKNTTVPVHANIIFNPIYWINRTHLEMQNHNCSANPARVPDKLFLSLNTQPWIHRCDLIDSLAKHNLLDDGSISWHILPKNYNWKYWKPTKLVLDIDYTTNLDSYKTLPIEFNTTFMSIVAESTMKSHFITEKTWMPVFLKKPFLIWGPPKIHQHFASLGFKLYNEIFDYRFDKVKDYNQRLEMIVQQLIKLKEQDLSKMKRQIHETLEFNYNHALQLANK